MREIDTPEIKMRICTLDLDIVVLDWISASNISYITETRNGIARENRKNRLIRI